MCLRKRDWEAISATIISCGFIFFKKRIIKIRKCGGLFEAAVERELGERFIALQREKRLTG